MLKTENRKLNTSSAFTLIEILVVIAVIAVLSALLMSVSKTAMSSANLAKSISNLKTIGMASRYYANDHNGRFPLYGFEEYRGMSTEGNIAHYPSVPQKLMGPDFGPAYLETCDVFYSPFLPGTKSRVKGSYFKDPGGTPYIGYYYFSLPHPEDMGMVYIPPRGGVKDLDRPGSDEIFNNRLADDPRAVLYCDVPPGTPVGEFTGKQCTVLHLDGAVNSFPYSEFKNLGPTARAMRLIKR